VFVSRLGPLSLSLSLSLSQRVSVELRELSLTYIWLIVKPIFFSCPDSFILLVKMSIK
jgi:hypothetical protein